MQKRQTAERPSVRTSPAPQALIDEASDWEGVTTGPHRFDAVEFRLGGRELGHYHRSGVLDLSFPKNVRDALIEQDEAEVHRYASDSGWVTFRVRSEADAEHALCLLRLSYLQKVVAAGEQGPGLRAVRTELAQLPLSRECRACCAGLLARRERPTPAAPNFHPKKISRTHAASP